MGHRHGAMRTLDFSYARANLISKTPRLGELIYGQSVTSSTEAVPHWSGFHVTRFLSREGQPIAMAPLFVGNVQAAASRFRRDGDSFLRANFSPEERDWIWDEMRPSPTGQDLRGFQQITGLLGIKLGILVSLGWTHQFPLGLVRFDVMRGALTRVHLCHELEDDAVRRGIDPHTSFVRFADFGHMSMGMAVFARLGERLPFRGFGLALVNPRVITSAPAVAVGKAIAKAMSPVIRTSLSDIDSRRLAQRRMTQEAAAAQKVLPPDGEISEIAVSSGAGRAAVLYHAYPEMVTAFATVANP